eukprot:s3770_g3.t1
MGVVDDPISNGVRSPADSWLPGSDWGTKTGAGGLDCLEFRIAFSLDPRKRYLFPSSRCVISNLCDVRQSLRRRVWTGMSWPCHDLALATTRKPYNQPAIWTRMGKSTAGAIPVGCPSSWWCWYTPTTWNFHAKTVEHSMSLAQSTRPDRDNELVHWMILEMCQQVTSS